jgi:hypothetical protein
VIRAVAAFCISPQRHREHREKSGLRPSNISDFKGKNGIKTPDMGVSGADLQSFLMPSVLVPPSPFAMALRGKNREKVTFVGT